MIQMSYLRAQLPAPHDVPRMEYRFPQMISQGPAIGMRPTIKGCGPGGRPCSGATSLPVQMVSGLGGLGTLAFTRLGSEATIDKPTTRILLGYAVIGTIGGLFSGYHGYKRNRSSVGAAIGWGVLGFFFPLITGVVALAQGYAEPKRR